MREQQLMQIEVRRSTNGRHPGLESRNEGCCRPKSTTPEAALTMSPQRGFRRSAHTTYSNPTAVSKPVHHTNLFIVRAHCRSFIAWVKFLSRPLAEQFGGFCQSIKVTQSHVREFCWDGRGASEGADKGSKARAEKEKAGRSETRGESRTETGNSRGLG